MWTLILLLGSSFAETSLGWTYHYSKDKLNWTEAREWCRKYYTDMLVIQNQEENDYVVSILPNQTKSPYYWIGITRNHINGTWTWIGNNSTWVGEHSWAPNEPNNNDITEFCVEIYVNSGANRGKWNDEKCGSKKFPVCYEAQCNATSCDRGRCQETIENTTCICEPGFKGDRCQTVVECDKDKITVPSNGSVECTHQYGNFSYNSSCQYSCEEGYRLSMSRPLTCTASTKWSDQPPTCKCESKSKNTMFCAVGPERGAHLKSQCSQSLTELGPVSSCSFSCEAGFDLQGTQTISVLIFNLFVPPAVECPSLLQPDNGNYSCSGRNRTFNTTCRFDCHPGFLMIGSPAVTCGVTGVWSGPRPTCASMHQLNTSITKILVTQSHQLKTVCQNNHSAKLFVQYVRILVETHKGNH
uniref:E-selectin n=1 Tax=Sparus aurata TaxID=8175 RepID=A0A671VEA0_SPAAU